MSDVSRRDLLRTTAVAAATGALALAAPVPASPKAFTAHEFQTLHTLSGMILPADKDSPGAKEAGAAAWIDLMASQNPELAAIFTGGIAWLDEQMRHRGHEDFLGAPESDQTALLDRIAFRANDAPEFGPGIRFFSWARRLVVDAWVTSPIGTKALGYMGNTGVSEFVVPAASLTWAIERSPA